MIRRVLAVALAAAGLAAVPSLAPPAGAAGPPVFLLGDSVMAAQNYGGTGPVTERYSMTLDAAVCRRLVATSCTYQGVRPASALDVLRARAGGLGDAVVMMVGYNDAPLGAAADAVMSELDRQGVPIVLWLTYRSPGGRYDGANSQLAAAAAAHPRVRLADWNGYSAGRSSWFAGDGLHLSASGRTALAGFVAGELDAAFSAVGACAAPPETPTIPGPTEPPPVVPGHFTAVAPVRLLDTRDGTGTDRAGMRPAGDVVVVRRPAAVPVNATGLLLSVTVTEPCGDGFVTAYPCGAGPPTASNLNHRRDETVPNLVAVQFDGEGRVCLLTWARAHLVADLTGYLGPSGDGFTALPPARVLDTRDGTGGMGAPFAAGTTTPVALPVPPGATAAVVNVTAADPQGAGYLTVHPCTQPAPNTSNVNYVAGSPRGALAVAAVDAAGTTCVTTWATTDVAVDLAGWFGPAGGPVTLVPPSRALDTRTMGRAMGAGTTAALPLTVPPGATAAIVNLTATEPAGPGYLSVHPCDQAPPNASNVNFETGETVANLVTVGLGAGGTACVTASQATHVVVDLAGRAG